MTDWRKKLLAFLHDPPEKAYDYSRRHEERAEAHAATFDLSLKEWSSRNPDWSASAADRFILPRGSLVSENAVTFIHPLSGELTSFSFPSAGDAEEFLGNIRPNFGPAGDECRFWQVWRLWLEFAATHHAGQGKGAEYLPYLPADTRIPDSTIWHHCSIASAMESTRGKDGRLHPGFLLFQMNPVQDFIAQARSTRDLWSGSYLLSWLMAHALRCVADQLGPDCVIFPSLRGQPLYDWLNRERLDQAFFTHEDRKSESYWNAIVSKDSRNEERVLTPNLPNRFLAVVPATFDPAAVVQAVTGEWLAIAEACKDWLARNGCPLKSEQVARWDWQVGHFWQPTWQVWPWEPAVKRALDLFKQVPSGRDSSLHQAHAIAHAIPNEEKDGKCYREKGGSSGNRGELDPGWAWSAHYQLLQHRLDARRQTRDFKAWQGTDKVLKDDYSGKEEEVIDDKWHDNARVHLPYLFRQGREHLAAPNLIKRVWHKAYLDEKRGLTRARQSFDSVPAVAAAPWRDRVLLKLDKDDAAWHSLMAFQETVNRCRKFLPFELPKTEQEGRWLENIDAGVLQVSFWERLGQNAEEKALTDKARRALANLIGKSSTGHPSTYYAVLALDGDEMGKWLSGEKAPKVKDVLSRRAVEYFKDKAKFPEGEAWLDSPRPVSPSFHLQFSEALSNFGLYCARRIVEIHHGQLIYAGGDDVLAMLPAEDAIACAEGLRMAFRGDPALAGRYPSVFRIPFPGFVELLEGDWSGGCRRPSEPSWPLLVPGPEATVSIGIAIGHIKEPLQDMIESAQAAEKRAKGNLGRNALAVTLFKRSGESIEWGATFRPEPFDLLAVLRDHYRRRLDDPDRAMPISGKFPYRVAELLRVYEPVEKVDQTLHDIAANELSWAINQLPNQRENSAVFDDLRTASLAWLGAVREAGRPLADFYNLFAIEAFIARQGE